MIAPWLVGYGRETGAGPVGLSDVIAGLATIVVALATLSAAARRPGRRSRRRSRASADARAVSQSSRLLRLSKRRSFRAPSFAAKQKTVSLAHAGAGVDRPPGPSQIASSTMPSGIAEAARGPAGRRGEHRRDHPPVRVHHRPARVSRADPPAQRRHAAPHRPAPVGVLADHGQRRPEPARRSPGRDRSPGSRGSRPRSPAGARSRARQDGRPEPGDPQHGHVVVRVEARSPAHPCGVPSSVSTVVSS